MKNMRKNSGRVIAGIVLAALLATLIPAALNGFNLTEVKAEQLSEDEKRIAADISNTTGVEMKEILKLHENGLSWNEILDRLKGRLENTGDRKQRDKLLTNDGIGADYIEALKKEGFKNEEIMEAKLLVERVLFQLHEITGENGFQPADPQAEINTEIKNTGSGQSGNEEDISPYTELEGKLDARTAVMLMLKLRQEFGSFERVLDEYLYALQAGLALEEYLKDREAYEKQKDEKSLTLDAQKVITMAKIEEMMLKKLQQSNTQNKPDTPDRIEPGETPDKTEADQDIPKPPVPDMEDVKPKNPSDEIMNEIKQISPVNQ